MQVVSLRFILHFPCGFLCCMYLKDLHVVPCPTTESKAMKVNWMKVTVEVDPGYAWQISFWTPVVSKA